VVRDAVATALLSLALGACSAASAVVPTSGRQLSYGEVQAAQPGLTAAQVLDAFGEPARVTRSQGGRVRAAEYAVRDAQGTSARLFLEFDDREVLVGRRYTGAVTRP
jgi:hypothetical protein